MALIGKIRNNMWLLIIFLGLGLAGFIFMDVSSAGGGGGASQFEVGRVNGDKIDWLDFQRAEDALYSGSSVDVYGRRDYLWKYFIEDAIVRRESDNLGLVVGSAELEELQFGNRLSPIVMRNFADPQTGQIDRETLNNFRQAALSGTLAPQYQRFWEFQQEEIVKDRLQSKLINLVKKSIYTPTWIVEEQQALINVSVDFRYVLIPFDRIEDHEITVTDQDYADYVKEHHALYDREEEMRDARFVVFDVLPTPEDSMLLLERFEETLRRFHLTDDDSTFAVNNYGAYDVTYHLQEELTPVIADSVFSMPFNNIFGPYIDEGAYNAVKVLDRKIIPDSVHSRHILISVQTQEQVAEAFVLADTLINQLNRDIAAFDSLATLYSQDPGSSALGGDLGFVARGAFVKPMNDLLFYRETERGKVYRVASQFGIHIVEVLDKKYESNREGVQIATIRENIIPSDLTQDMLFDDALEFAGQNRTMQQLRLTIAGREDLVLEESNNLSKNAFNFGRLGEGSTSREIIRWLFDPQTKVNTVAPTVFVYEDEVNYFNARYVIVGLDQIHPKGLATPASVLSFIEGPVKNRKRAEVIKEQITTRDISALAAQFDAELDTIQNVNFGLQFLSNIGDEPKVLATATALEPGQISEPIAGNNGVYVIEILDRSPAFAAQNVPQLRRQTTMQVSQAVEFELLPALKKNARIRDNRYNFF